MADLIEGFEIDTDLLLTETELTTFSGKHSKFPHHEVLTSNKCIQMTGVLDKIKAWREEDRGGKHPGGPTPYINDRTILVILMLLAREHSPLNETSIAEVMHRRLEDESRDYLGIPYALPPVRPDKGGTEEKNWQNHAHNAFHRILDTMDPHPDTKGKRRKMLRRTERQEILTARDLNLMRRRKERLDWFTQQYLQMTFTMQPRRLRRRQRTANISVDQTPVGVYTRRGNPKGEGTGEATKDTPVKEMDAGWYKKGDEWVWGYAANFAVSTANTAGEKTNYPITIRGFTLSIPTQGVGDEAVKLAQQLVEAKHDAGRITFDKGYQGIELHKGLRRLGYSPVFDLKTDDFGLTELGQNGSIFVEGAHYCPGMPEDLINASTRAADLAFAEVDYRGFITERANYELRYKEAGTRPGTHKLMCPALGKQARVECPLREIHPESSKKSKPYVLKRNAPPADKLPPICRQHSATFVENEQELPYRQDNRYGSREWAETYEADRNMVEGVNGYIKDERKENLRSAARRSAAGIAAQQVLVTMLVVSANMRKLQSFLKEEAQAAIRSIESRYPRLRLRDNPTKGWGTYKRKWGRKLERLTVTGRDEPLEIIQMRT